MVDCARPAAALSLAQSPGGAGRWVEVIIRKPDGQVIAVHKRRAGARDVLAKAAKPSREEIVADLRRIRAMAPKGPRTDSIDDAQFHDIVLRIAEGPIAYRLLASRAATLARALDQPIYDCLYLALAEAEDVAMATADWRLVAAVRGTAFAGRVSLRGQSAAR